MKRRRAAVVLFLLASLGATLGADSWRLPSRERFYSMDRKIRLEVIPRKLESQLKFFEDKTEGREPAGAAAGAPTDGPRATLSERQFFWYKERSSFPLVNDVAPVTALVSGAGDYVVTFDEWHSVGYGDAVVVIYRADGSLVRRFELTDLVDEADIEHFERSTSSLWWRQAARLDPATGDLVLRVASSQTDLPAQWSRSQEIRVELATGLLREPTLRRWPRRTWKVSAMPASNEEAFPTARDVTCIDQESTFDTTGTIALPSSQLLAMATDRPTPDVPPIAVAARVTGTVLVEVLIAAEGDVRCARALAGAPLLSRAAVQGALRWRFRPRVESSASRFVGRLEFRFGSEWIYE